MPCIPYSKKIMQYPFQENLYHKHTENVLEARVEDILNFDNEHI